MTSTGAYPPGCTQADVDRAHEGDEPLDPPTEEEQRAEAWEYWQRRALNAERSVARPVTDALAMRLAREIVERHIAAYGYVPHPDKMKEAIARALGGGMNEPKSPIGHHT